MTVSVKAWRSAILHNLADPAEVGVEASYQYFEDGLLVVENDKIIALGDSSELLPIYQDIDDITTVENGLITPGFVDTHIHYPQTGIIASYGEQLLDWLNNYTFPAEGAFHDKEYARSVADVFLNELLRNGTTTALVFGTVHKESVDAFFEASEKRNLRMIAGKVMMDRHAPDFLVDTPETSYQDSKELIQKWHEKGRLHYAVTPRFAPTSTSEQLTKAGELLAEFDNLYMHTHLSENQQECEWVSSLFPDSKNYLDVYDQHKLLSERSVFAHGIHLCDDEYHRLNETGSAIAFCPTSNLFLGSGLFRLNKAEEHNVNVGLGTDVGGGTSFSMLQTLSEAYKVIQLQGEKLSPFKSLYLATLGGAKALRLEDKIGNLAVGTEADFVILDYQATPLLQYRLEHSKSLDETLFVLMTLGDDRSILKTYSAGKCVHSRD
ncbi:guanine deaminase [Marinomonas sp. 15G1-11]|uniref:Guanine deaminase n=1 Tax=Marinomonas phaeophyticola TaxID=3004091 RepID=A0ABT4JWM2_9GAMM|nr:guanine deaminase [Marinomonas sp. 15G1-11]MCZ2722734.1 guanine deaminase [Marinomonas sp. 15G1-11]